MYMNRIFNINILIFRYCNLLNYIKKEYGNDTVIPIPKSCEMKEKDHFQIYFSFIFSLLYNRNPWIDNNLPNSMIVRLLELLECNIYNLCINIVFSLFSSYIVSLDKEIIYSAIDLLYLIMNNYFRYHNDSISFKINQHLYNKAMSIAITLNKV